MPSLCVSDVSVAGADGRIILRVAGLDVAAGEALGVRGPSGAGKSTLLHVLSGLLRPQTGTIHWDESDIASMSEHARDAFRLRYMGLIFQDFLLFEELSALDNAAVSAAYSPRSTRAALRERAAELLQRLGIAASGRNVATFSGGERQRIAVARALSTNPRVILADEPTASLDRANANRLISDMLALARQDGRTIIAVSHDPAVTDAMDRVIEVIDGVVRT